MSIYSGNIEIWRIKGEIYKKNIVYRVYDLEENKFKKREYESSFDIDLKLPFKDIKGKDLYSKDIIEIRNKNIIYRYLVDYDIKNGIILYFIEGSYIIKRYTSETLFTIKKRLNRLDNGNFEIVGNIYIYTKIKKNMNGGKIYE